MIEPWPEELADHSMILIMPIARNYSYLLILPCHE